MKIVWEPCDCSIIVDGTLVGFINPDFANAHRIGISEMEMLRDTHRKIYVIKKAYEKSILEEGKEPRAVTWAFVLLDSLDLELQALWGFPEDRSRLTHWNQLKGCTCLHIPGKPRPYNPSCPYHNHLASKEIPNGNSESI